MKQKGSTCEASADPSGHELAPADQTADKQTLTDHWPGWLGQHVLAFFSSTGNFVVLPSGTLAALIIFASLVNETSKAVLKTVFVNLWAACFTFGI